MLLIAAFCEAQPFVLEAMAGPQTGNLSGLLSKWVNAISAILAPVGAVIAFLASKLGEFVKSATESPKWSAKIWGFAARAAIYLAEVIVPFVLWVIYLNVTQWGLCINIPGTCSAPTWLQIVADSAFNRPWHSATTLHCDRSCLFHPYAVHAAECELAASALPRPSRQGLSIYSETSDWEGRRA